MVPKGVAERIRSAALRFWRSGVLGVAGAPFLLGVTPAHADDWQLVASPGVCTYSYDRVVDETTTRCEASAIVLETASSLIYRCTASVEGNQFLAPPVEENAPDSVTCWATSRVLLGDGPYGMMSLDDAFIDENTRTRRRGSFTWSNAFWVYARSGAFDIRLCAASQTVQNPDFAQRCSQRIDWPADRDAPSDEAR